MSEADGPVEPDFNEASQSLNEGIRSCRAMLSGYRVLLSEHLQGANDDDEIPADANGAEDASGG